MIPRFGEKKGEIMTLHKQDISRASLEKGYEENVVGVRGVVAFGVGLFLLIVITFWLMWALHGVLEERAKETKSSDNPMAMNDRERLPPEPRLQGAPGFGVDTPNGRVNLELTAPQSEYRVLEKEWKALIENGARDPKSGAVTVLPIEEAKKILLEEKPAARNSPEAERLLTESQLRYSSASSGREMSMRRR
ncbi:MAG: hypothetical protein C4324_00700 [Blastocatellia bacterium]